MAGPNYGLAKGFKAGGAISQFHCVELGAGEVVTQCNAAGDSVIGIAQEAIPSDDATRGRIVGVLMEGIARCIAGGAISIGAPVRTNASGRVVALAATTANQNQVGIALQAAGNDGEHVDIFLTPGVSRTTV